MVFLSDFLPWEVHSNSRWEWNVNEHPAALDSARLLRDCEMRTLRRSGPGGQHRNKVETAVVLQHRPTGIQAEANERRSQSTNHAVAVRRLRVNLAIGIRSDQEPEAPTSHLWRSRCQNGRIRVNPDHEDFPALLAEALDYVAHSQWDVAAAATRLACTTSQLVKFLKDEPRAMALVNHERELVGLRRLK